MGLAVFLFHLYFNAFKSNELDEWIEGEVKNIERRETIAANVGNVAKLRVGEDNREVSPIIYNL